MQHEINSLINKKKYIYLCQVGASIGTAKN